MSHTRSRPLRAGLVVFAVMVALLFSPMAPTTLISAQEDDPLRVVASFSIVEDWTSRVGGDHIELSSIVPAGGDAHTFDPDPATVASIADAAVILSIGSGFEPWLNSMVDASGAEATVVHLADHMSLSDGEGGDHEDEAAHEDGHDHGDSDPHIWGDVSNVITSVDVIAQVLADADPDNAGAYQDNAEAYIAELETLDTSIREHVASVPEENRKLVTSHDTFGHYADAYGFEVIGTALGSTSADAGDPAAGDVASLVNVIEDSGVPAIFAENTVNPDLMQSIADEAGVELAPTLYTDALGEDGSDGDTYIGMMTFNTDTIVAALGGE